MKITELLTKGQKGCLKKIGTSISPSTEDKFLRFVRGQDSDMEAERCAEYRMDRGLTHNKLSLFRVF